MKITEKQQENKQEQQPEKALAYKASLDEVCAKRDELLRKNQGVQDAIARMENELAQTRIRNEHETDLDKALEQADKCSELERKIAYAKKIKSTNVLDELKAFCNKPEYRQIWAEAETEYQEFMEGIHQFRRDMEEEVKRRFSTLDQHLYRRAHDFMDNLLSYGGWSVLGWTMEVADEVNQRAEERRKQGH
jgi:hypothetical protein